MDRPTRRSSRPSSLTAAALEPPRVDAPQPAQKCLRAPLQISTPGRGGGLHPWRSESANLSLLLPVPSPCLQEGRPLPETCAFQGMQGKGDRGISLFRLPGAPGQPGAVHARWCRLLRGVQCGHQLCPGRLVGQLGGLRGSADLSFIVVSWLYAIAECLVPSHFCLATFLTYGPHACFD